MSAKSISISLPEAFAWKLDQLEERFGISRSTLMQRALLLLVGDISKRMLEFGQIKGDCSEEDIEAEYQKAQSAS